jgi:hypothetical protein
MIILLQNSCILKKARFINVGSSLQCRRNGVGNMGTAIWHSHPVAFVIEYVYVNKKLIFVGTVCTLILYY